MTSYRPSDPPNPARTHSFGKIYKYVYTAFPSKSKTDLAITHFHCHCSYQYMEFPSPPKLRKPHRGTFCMTGRWGVGEEGRGSHTVAKINDCHRGHATDRDAGDGASRGGLCQLSKILWHMNFARHVNSPGIKKVKRDK